MKNHEKPTWKHEKPWKPNLEPWKTMKNYEKPWKTNLEPWKTINKNVTDAGSQLTREGGQGRNKQKRDWRGVTTDLLDV